MIKFLNPYLEAKLRFIFYKIRFLLLYTIFGVLSIFIEFFIRFQLKEILNNESIVTFLAIFSGITFAFWANVNYNFSIPKSKRNRALKYFIMISILSALIQIFIKIFLGLEKSNYEINRLIISGTVFIFAYGLHRKYSFRDYKKVGVAIYANGYENLEKIYKKIGQFSDFIHVDIIDSSMNSKAKEVKIHKLETMKAYWPDTQIQTHIMSLNPENWIDKVIPFSDVIYIHKESQRNINNFFKKIKKNKKKAGLALMMSTEVNEVINLLKEADYVLLLTIQKPGSSGQIFSKDAIEKVKYINSLNFRNKFTLCIDGGVNESNINFLNAENIVSGSSVLNDSNPKQQIMRLQTSGRYQ